MITPFSMDSRFTKSSLEFKKPPENPSILKISTFIVIFIASFSGLYINWPRPDLTVDLMVWRDEGNYFLFNDQSNQLNYSIFFRDDVGKGRDALLCLHGFPTSSFDWKKIYNGLRQEFDRIIAPDFLGFGFSQKPVHHHIITPSKIIKMEHNYTILQQADIIESLLSHLNITEVHILAHDYGDTVAQELVFRYNLRQRIEDKHRLKLKSLILLNGGIIPDAHHPFLIQKLYLYPAFASIASAFSNYWIFKHSLVKVFGPTTQPDGTDLWNWWVQLRYNEGDLVLGRLLHYIPERQLHKARWITALKDANFPIQMIYGQEDPVNPPPFEELYRQLFPNSNINVLTNTGHYVQWESPAETLSTLKSFLAKT